MEDRFIDRLARYLSLDLSQHLSRHLSHRFTRARLFGEGGRIPDEDDVLQLAIAWSLDPSRLSEAPGPAALRLPLDWPEALTA